MEENEIEEQFPEDADEEIVEAITIVKEEEDSNPVDCPEEREDIDIPEKEEDVSLPDSEIVDDEPLTLPGG